MLHVGSPLVSAGTAVARFENTGGTCTVTPDAVGGVTCTSDENLKKDIASWQTSATQLLSLIDVKEYRMKTDAESTPKQVGFIAQNVEKTLPWLVKTDALTGSKAVSYAGFTPILVQALKEINDKFTGVYNDITFWVRDLKADTVTTKMLCVDDVCVTKEQFKKMVEQSSVAPSSPVVVPAVVTPPVIEPTAPVTQPVPVDVVPSVPVSDVASSTEISTVAPVDSVPVVEIPVETVSPAVVEVSVVENVIAPVVEVPVSSPEVPVTP
jgi:hypothetical protein